MSTREEKPLKELIDKMLRAYGLGDKMDEIGLLKSWEAVVGKMIARHTTDLYFTKGILHVKLDSSTLRQELSYAKSSLISQLNKHAGKRMVTDIHLK